MGILPYLTLDFDLHMYEQSLKVIIIDCFHLCFAFVPISRSAQETWAGDTQGQRN